MTQLQIIVLYIAFDIALTKAYIEAAQLRNYCAGNSNPDVSMTHGNLLGSVITQMQLNSDGSMSCTTIIADQVGDQYATGNTILVGLFFSFDITFSYQVQFLSIYYSYNIFHLVMPLTSEFI